MTEKIPNSNKSYMRDQRIKECLSTGDKTFGEIKKFLETKGLSYKKNSGLNFRLQSLRNQEIIDKHKTPENSFPTWHLTERELKDAGIQAKLFADHAVRKILEIPIPPKGYRSKEKRLLKKMVEEIGVYAMFTLLRSYKLASEKTSYKEISETHSAWMNNALPIPFVSTYLHLQLQDLLYPQVEYDMTTPYDCKKIKKVEELEKLLEELYRKETTACKKVFKNLPEISKRASWLNQYVKELKLKEKMKR